MEGRPYTLGVKEFPGIVTRALPRGNTWNIESYRNPIRPIEFGPTIGLWTPDIVIEANGLIGYGGYGTVYRGYVIERDGKRTPVVIKIASRPVHTGSPNSEEFLKELAIFEDQSANPTCSNSVTCIYGAFTCNMGFTRYYYECMILERMEGDLRSLGQAIRYAPVIRQDIKLHLLLYIGLHMAFDISKLHNAGFFHNDIKPDNFLFKWDPPANRYRIKISDFGLACSMDFNQHLKDRLRRAGKPEIADVIPDSLKCYALSTEGYMTTAFKELFNRKMIYGTSQPIRPDEGTDYKRIFRENDISAISITVNEIAGLMGLSSADWAARKYECTPVQQALVNPATPKRLRYFTTLEDMIRAYAKAMEYMVKKNVPLIRVALKK